MMNETEEFVSIDHPFLIPPGAHVREWLEGVEMSVKEFASRIGASKQTVNKFFNGKQALTPEMAQKLERVTSISASFWSKLEADYQNELARRNAIDEVQAKCWINSFPVKELIGRKVLPSFFKQLPLVDQREKLLKFFGVGDEAAYYKTFNDKKFAARTVKGTESSKPSLMAWVQQGLREADGEELPAYDAEKFSLLLDQISPRTLSLRAGEGVVARWLIDLRKSCNDVGVHLLFIHQLKGMRHVNGVTTWRNGRPVIILSLYGGGIDKILFSFFHEAGHVIKHRKSLTYVTCATESPMEDEADSYASNKIINAHHNSRILSTNGNVGKLKMLADDLGVYSGLVFGRYCYLRKYDKSCTFLCKKIISFTWEKDQWKLA